MSNRNEAILEILRNCYPNPKPELNFTNSYEALISVMLSAQCTDKQVNKVTPKLFHDYPDISSLANAQTEEVYSIVRSCGFKSKADNIVSTCQMLVSKFDSQIPCNLKDLVSLPGVGQKTANVVLANAFNIPTIAVDTHVFRVSNRLGLANSKNVKVVEKQLMEVIPRGDWIDAHHWLIFHGRRVCKARNPACDRCPLYELCENSIN